MKENMKEKFINWLIKIIKADTNKISDGYHTFEQLYEHRIKLWMALCQQKHNLAWVSKTHSDGSKWKGWFIMGIGKTKGEQMTYHLPMKYWGKVRINIKTLDKAPDYDGHTPNDVLKRLERFT